MVFRSNRYQFVPYNLKPEYNNNFNYYKNKNNIPQDYNNNFDNNNNSNNNNNTNNNNKQIIESSKFGELMNSNKSFEEAVAKKEQMYLQKSLDLMQKIETRDQEIKMLKESVEKNKKKIGKLKKQIKDQVKKEKKKKAILDNLEISISVLKKN